MTALQFLTPYLTGDHYLLSTNLKYWLTPKKITAAVVVVVAVIAVVVWFVRRRQTGTRSGV